MGIKEKIPDNKPHPFLVVSLLTDSDINSLITQQLRRNSLTLKDIMKETALHEMAPYLLLHDIDLIKLSEEWGKFGKNKPKQFLDNFLKNYF